MSFSAVLTGIVSNEIAQGVDELATEYGVSKSKMVSLILDHGLHCPFLHDTLKNYEKMLEEKRARKISADEEKEK